MTSGDEFLDAILTQAQRTNDLLAQVVARLPEPAPEADRGSGQVHLREPEQPPAARPQQGRRQARKGG